MFRYDFMVNAFIVGILISILCTSIGLFAVLKGYSMIGDTLAHGSLAGAAVGALIGFDPLITAVIFSVCFGVLGETLRNYYKKYFELIMVIILSLGTGIALNIMNSGKLKSDIN
jgi:zinc transport system permease protein